MPKKFLSVAFCPAMCVFVPLFAVTLHGPQNISPQHPSLCSKKKENFSFPPLPHSLSFTTLTNDWSSLRSQPWDSFPGPQQPGSAHKSPQSLYDEIDWMKMFIMLPAWNPRSVWSPLLLQQNRRGGRGWGLAERIPFARSSHLQLRCSKSRRGKINLFAFSHNPSQGKPLIVASLRGFEGSR